MINRSFIYRFFKQKLMNKMNNNNKVNLEKDIIKVVKLIMLIKN